MIHILEPGLSFRIFSKQEKAFNSYSDLKKIPALIVMIILVKPLFSQEHGFIPSSPTVSELEKYIEVPVSHYTGIPDISIPIFEIQANGVTVPIALSYHAGGIKADQEATWVGLGWSLNVGGSISQNVKNWPDQDPVHGYMNNLYKLPDVFLTDLPYTFYPLYAPRCYDILTGFCDYTGFYDVDEAVQYLTNSIEMVSDEYYFNFNGYSGKFILDENNGPLILDLQNIKIIPYQINEWKALTPDGCEYIFKDYFEIMKDYYELHDLSYTTYLKKIISPRGEEINFTYQYSGSLKTLPTYSEFYKWSQKSGLTVDVNRDFGSFGGGLRYSQIMPESITYKDIRIEFHTSNTRKDIQNAHKLDSIEIYNDNELIKTYIFDYGLFHADPQYGNYAEDISEFDVPGYTETITYDGRTFTYNTILGGRLKLNSLTLVAGTEEQEYNFNYYEDNLLPYKTSYAKDYWGYFNGAINWSVNESHYLTYNLIADPKVLYKHITIPNKLLEFYSDVNREPNIDYAKTGTLRSITYPTKGKSEYSYELNTYSNFYCENAWTTTPFNSAIYDNNSPGSPGPAQLPFDVNGDPGDIIMVDFDINFSYGFYPDLLVIPPTGGEDNHVKVWNVNDPGTLIIEKYMTYAMRDDREKRKIFESVPLQPGSYILQVSLWDGYGDQSGSGGQPGPYYNTSCMVSYVKNIEPLDELPGAGIRVSQIILSPEDATSPSITKTFAYTGGKLMSPLFFYRTTPTPPIPFGSYSNLAEPDGWATDFGDFQQIKTSPASPMSGSAQGSYIGYSKVEISENGNGRTVLEFHNTEDISPTGIYDTDKKIHPFLPNVSDHMNGKLKVKSLYDNSDTKVQTQSFEYVYSHDHDETLYRTGTWGMSDQIVDVYNGLADSPPYNYGKMVFNYFGERDPAGQEGTYIWFYPHLAYKTYLIEKTTTKHLGNGDASQTTYFTHNKEGNISRTRTIQSDGTALDQYTLYPSDYSESVTNFIDDLRDAHIIDLPIEQYTVKDSAYYIDGTITTYKTGEDLALPDIVYKLEAVNSQEPFQPSNFENGFDIASKYKPEVYYENYDENGNLLQYHQSDNIPVSFIWGYNNTLPIAKAENAECDEILHESFESSMFSAYQSPSNPKTGRYSYGYPYDVELPSPGEYLLTYWQRESLEQDWELVKQTITSDVTINSGSIQIDEVRLYPADARMTTYTYDPLVGVTSITDERNVTTYYEYDDFNRLKYIKDFEGNILKRYEYNYADD